MGLKGSRDFWVNGSGLYGVKMPERYNQALEKSDVILIIRGGPACIFEGDPDLIE